MAQNITSTPEGPLEDWVVEPLAPYHVRGEFSCGVESLDVFLRQQASQNAKKDFSNTFVAISELGSSAIVGYYTLAMGSVEFDHFPKEKHLPHYPVPIAHLGRLAVGLRYRGRHIGEFLLFHALLRVRTLFEKSALLPSKSERWTLPRAGFMPSTALCRWPMILCIFISP